MKKIFKLTTAVLLLLALLLSTSATLISCEDNSGEGSGENGGNDNGGNGGSDSSNKVDYTVNVKTIGGRPIGDLSLNVYSGDDLVGFGKTGADGTAKVSLEPKDGYTVELSTDKLDGYNVEPRYSFTGKTANIVLISEVIADTDITGVNYELGDIMHDFSVLTTDGTTFTLSEALKTKKAVLINFWYSTCSPCINEFPYMQSAYEKYSDDIAVIALNNFGGDNENAVKLFKADMGLTFPVSKDYSTLGSAFNLQGYPTSIIVDRYGTICLIEIGGLTSEKPFVAAFDHFRADNYEQKLFESIDELTPLERPNIEMPSSEEIGAALNGANLEATYAPETESSNSEYSWPFIVGTKNGENCIYNSNSYKDSSYATIHATISLKAGEALAVDWFAETELGVDILYVLVNEKDIYQISGMSEDWSTCYPYVAVDDGEYKVSFVYVKDDGTDEGEDRVYLKNLRIVDQSDIDTATYIPRQAATKPNANGLGYQKYVNAVYSEKDGYYHANSEDGPLLLVNLMGSTQLSETSLNDLGYNLQLKDSKGDIYETLVDYCNYSINGTLYGYSPVTMELKELLERAAEIVGFEPGNPDQWLQTCIYYEAYATDGKQLDDPVKGIAFFAAFDTVLSTETETKYNTVTYDGRLIMPRGVKFKFVPEVSGAYVIESQSKDEVNGWIFDSNYEIIHTASVVERPYNVETVDTTNVKMVIYMEAGKEYYIDIAYYDIYAAGEFTFTIHYIAKTYEQFHLASPAYFTYIESATGQLNQTIAGGINVALGADGYYHELLSDGSLGSIVYADFKYPTGLFSHSILEMIELDGFNFMYSDTDLMVIAKLKEFGGDVDACRNYYKQLWGDTYAEWEAIYELEDVLSGKYHGNGKDFKAEMLAYAEKMIEASEDAPELEGCVAVDAKLAVMLQALMDKYSFSGVENSWTKLCYYYKSIAP